MNRNRVCALIMVFAMAMSIAGCSRGVTQNEMMDEASSTTVSATESASGSAGDTDWNAMNKSRAREYVGQIEVVQETPGTFEIEDSGWSRTPYQEGEDGEVGYAISMGVKLRNVSDRTVGVCAIYEVIDKDGKVVMTTRTSEVSFGLDAGDVAPENILDPDQTGAIGITDTVGDYSIVQRIADPDTKLRLYLFSAPIDGYHTAYDYDRDATSWSAADDQETPFDGAKVVQASAKVKGNLPSERVRSVVSVLFYKDGHIVGGDSREADVDKDRADENYNRDDGLYADVLIGAICSEYDGKEFFISLIPGVHRYAGSPTADWSDWFKNEIGSFVPNETDVDRSEVEGEWTRVGLSHNNTPNYIELDH